MYITLNDCRAMTNIDIMEEGFYIILTIDGTDIENKRFPVFNTSLTIRQIVSNIISTFKLPTVDNGGNPIDYLLVRIVDDVDDYEALEFEDDNGKEMSFTDYMIHSGVYLHLISVVLAGGNSSLRKHIDNTQETDPVISYNATGRNADEGSIFDRSTSGQNKKHLLPEKTSFFKQIVRKINQLLSHRETVNTTVYAPCAAERGEVMTVQVMLYKDSQYAAAEKRAKMVDPDAEEKNNQVLGLPLKKGDIVAAHLSFFSPNMEKEYIVIEDHVKQVTWSSNIEDMTFSVFIDKRFSRKLLNGKVVIKLNDVPVSEMTFSVRIVDDKETIMALADICTTRLDKVFISYSHEDTDKVQYISETCKAIKCDYFFDRHSLDPGDIYPEKIFKYIDNANLFILCWSENAATSEWVEKERKRALDNFKNRHQSLHFYPISIPPKTGLPDDMKETFKFGELS